MVRIIGTGHSGFGRLPDSFEDLIVTVAREVLNEIGIAPAKIGGIWLRHFNAGRVDDRFASPLAMAARPGLRWTPATRGENARASGAAAIRRAMDAINAGRVQAALVIGAEKMKHLPTSGAAACLGRAASQPEKAGQSFPAIFARFARAYADVSATRPRRWRKLRQRTMSTRWQEWFWKRLNAGPIPSATCLYERVLSSRTQPNLLVVFETCNGLAVHQPKHCGGKICSLLPDILCACCLRRFGEKYRKMLKSLRENRRGAASFEIRRD